MGIVSRVFSDDLIKNVKKVHSYVSSLVDVPYPGVVCGL